MTTWQTDGAIKREHMALCDKMYESAAAFYSKLSNGSSQLSHGTDCTPARVQAEQQQGEVNRPGYQRYQERHRSWLSRHGRQHCAS